MGWGGNACVVGPSGAGRKGRNLETHVEKGECGLSFRVTVAPGPSGSWHRASLDRKARHSEPERVKALSIPGLCPLGW